MLFVPDFKIGDKITIQKLVREEDTALNYGSGQLENLLATPSLLALMIEASVKLLDPSLPEGYITIGKDSFVSHQKPTVLGETVSLSVEISKFDKKEVEIKMEAYDEVGLIGTGIHKRVVVNKEALLTRANEREVNIVSKNY
ncbi:MAG: thioesterase family protein [Firmicutes bacterium]|jgi:predicted thioesterase|nr:thioesterase family protein [Bacillota bacterium]